MIRVIGIDPGLRNTGWAVIEVNKFTKDVKFIDCGVIKTTTTLSLPARLHQLHLGIDDKIKIFAVQSAAIEETFVNMNYASSLKLAQARAAAMLSLSISGLTPSEYSATTVKKTIVGTGRAEKEQVMKMLRLIIKGLHDIKSQDASDALAIALCHAHHGLGNSFNYLS